jgi:hypothetical protein
MFAQLERLNDESLSGEQLQTEISRGKAMSEIGKVIVESAKTEVLALKLTGRLDANRPPKFLDAADDVADQPKRIERPPAIYTNIPIRKAE